VQANRRRGSRLLYQVSQVADRQTRTQSGIHTCCLTIRVAFSGHEPTFAQKYIFL